MRVVALFYCMALLALCTSVLADDANYTLSDIAYFMVNGHIPPPETLQGGGQAVGPVILGITENVSHNESYTDINYYVYDSLLNNVDIASNVTSLDVVAEDDRSNGLVKRFWNADFYENLLGNFYGLYVWIVNEYVVPAAVMVRDDAIVHNVVVNTDWVSVTVSTMTAWLISNKLESKGVDIACGTFCNDYTSDGINYSFCLYMHTKKGEECRFVESSRSRVMEAVIAGFKAQTQPDCVARCFTLFNSGSSVAYIKYVRTDGKVGFSDVKCKAVEGFGVPD